MHELYAHKKAPLFTACEAENGRPRVHLQAADVTDDTGPYPLNYLRLIIDVGRDRLRLTVREDGTWAMDNYDEDNIDPKAWAKKINVAAGDAHRGTAYAAVTPAPASESSENRR